MMMSKPLSKISIHHSNGHVTEVNINLSESKSLVTRVEENELFLNKVMEGISPHLNQENKIYLIIKSKFNEHSNQERSQL